MIVRCETEECHGKEEQICDEIRPKDPQKIGGVNSSIKIIISRHQSTIANEPKTRRRDTPDSDHKNRKYSPPDAHRSRSLNCIGSFQMHRLAPKIKQTDCQTNRVPERHEWIINEEMGSIRLWVYVVAAGTHSACLPCLACNTQLKLLVCSISPKTLPWTHTQREVRKGRVSYRNSN